MNILQLLKVVGLIWISYLIISSSIWFFPICFLMGVYIQLNLFTLGHEAIHNNLLPSKAFNDFGARVLCYFPILISYGKYRKLHLLHHKYLGTELDPDYNLYKNSDHKLSVYVLKQALRSITLKNLKFTLVSYTDIFSLREHKKLKYELDSHWLMLYWGIILLSLIKSELYVEFFLIWFVPILFFPSILDFYSKLQHGPYKKGVLESRNIELSVFNRLMFPMLNNLHESHHENPAIMWHEQVSKNSQSLISTIKDNFHG